jgi:hypothetical protein
MEIHEPCCYVACSSGFGRETRVRVAYTEEILLMHVAMSSTETIMDVFSWLFLKPPVTTDSKVNVKFLLCLIS